MSRINRIENIAQLRMELVRLKLQEVEQEEKIKNDISGLKKSLIAGAASYSVSYLVQKFVFKSSNPIVKTLISLLVSGATSVVASGKTDALFGKVKDFIMEKLGRKSSAEAFAFDEQKIYE
jgi:hypothetical protein